MRSFGFDEMGKHAKSIQEQLNDGRDPKLNFTEALNLVHRKIALWLKSGKIKQAKFFEEG